MPISLEDRQSSLEHLRHQLRPGQQSLADWAGGPLAISAVPGSGKSTGMAVAAAIAIARYQLHARRQLVLVTFTRAAAANLKAKVRRHLKDLALPQNSFVVFTLHGLALNIATRNPDLSGIHLDTLTLVSPSRGHRLIRASVEQWINSHPQLYQQLIEGQQFDGEETERLRRQSVLRTEILPELATTVIHEAKSSGLTPAGLMQIEADLARAVPGEAKDYQILTIAGGLYAAYQTLLQRRQLIDYDDMVLSALRVLKDPATRKFWQSRFFAVFEDEAQDSSPLQTQLLEILAGDTQAPSQAPNLVRVGDPNQAINSTFTPADPVFFNQFCQTCQQQGRLATIEQAGRSTPAIMQAANFLVTWANQTYPAATSPFRVQHIQGVGEDDPQPNANPAAIGNGVEIYQPADVEQTVRLIAQRVIELIAADPGRSAAILIREHRQGRFIRRLLQDPTALGLDLEQAGVRFYDVGERDRQSAIPIEMLSLLQLIERPHSAERLKAALQILVRRQCIPTQDLNQLVSQPEQFLYPGPLDPDLGSEAARQARRYCRAILRARLELPPYHLISFLSLTLQYNQSELATADKLATRIAQQTFGESSLSAMLRELWEIVDSEKFEGVETEDTDSIYTRSGQLTLMTMHKAKGLDWDAVFIPFLHEKTIPGQPWIPPQTRFLGDFSLSEVARAQIRACVHQGNAAPTVPNLLDAWTDATQLKQAEEFRLLYVAMTRAKRLLWLSAAQQAPFSWGKPENLQVAAPSPVLLALQRSLRQAV
ncbi:MAG: UvrD-helicase domain-containing protein [Leptolyngbyaceae cyanobacterium SM1_1_3]|nr:UvrD-helicase domain-containing protein [Leptolyngbyaceae cyanobacterium SM1_1_3]NJN04320.1 UvrD-helicase domain-containing protein [Leptolyngbyaceae cyanobacterium RM1_1_2]NJO10426.1 UvrD-helicase domain-containing protein [Leptolyngbyaceae cyanobacterium SL_1_1]